MVQEPNAHGICSTCNARFNCLSLKNSIKENRLIVDCEEFDNSSAGPDGCAGEGTTHSEYPQSKTMTPVKAPVAKGLCVNCEDNKTCRFPYFGSDVLFCEEHKVHTSEEREYRHAIHTFGTRPCFSITNLIPG